MKNLHQITIQDTYQDPSSNHCLTLSYQLFGQPLHSAPIVLVNHALTGNSQVSGEQGWWKTLVDYDATIDLNRFTVIAFDVPGNGYNTQENIVFTNYKELTTKRIAQYFWKALEQLDIKELFAIIGGSLGGSIGWEMFFQHPKRIKNLIPIATSYKSSDWLIANTLVQDSILNNSNNPIHDARMHAMLLYRTPASFEQKFKKEYLEDQQSYKVESWLNFHGQSLTKRYQLSSYKLMNHLLKTIGESLSQQKIQDIIINSTTSIHSIAVDSDYMFTYEEQQKAHQELTNKKGNYHFSQIQSIHGHDAFLIEYEQLNNLLINIFK
ncbi:alpha/beta fold hydrolase [Myroides sp. LJL116]